MNTRALLFALLVGSMTLAGTPHEPVGRTWESGDFGGSADSTYLADSTGVRQSGRIRVKLPGAEGGWGDLLAFEASAMDGEATSRLEILGEIVADGSADAGAHRLQIVGSYQSEFYVRDNVRIVLRGIYSAFGHAAVSADADEGTIDVDVAMQGRVTVAADAYLELPGQEPLKIQLTLTANESGILNVAFRTDADAALLDFGPADARRIEASVRTNRFLMQYLGGPLSTVLVDLEVPKGRMDLADLPDRMLDLPVDAMDDMRLDINGERWREEAIEAGIPFLELPMAGEADFSIGEEMLGQERLGFDHFLNIGLDGSGESSIDGSLEGFQARISDLVSTNGKGAMPAFGPDGRLMSVLNDMNQIVYKQAMGDDDSEPDWNDLGMRRIAELGITNLAAQHVVLQEFGLSPEDEIEGDPIDYYRNGGAEALSNLIKGGGRILANGIEGASDYSDTQARIAAAGMTLAMQIAASQEPEAKPEDSNDPEKPEDPDTRPDPEKGTLPRPSDAVLSRLLWNGLQNAKQSATNPGTDGAYGRAVDPAAIGRRLEKPTNPYIYPAEDNSDANIPMPGKSGATGIDPFGSLIQFEHGTQAPDSPDRGAPSGGGGDS